MQILGPKINRFIATRSTEKRVLKTNQRVSNSSGVGKFAFTILKYMILMFFGFLVLFPFFTMLMTSLMTFSEATSVNPVLVPSIPVLWNNYYTAFNNGYWSALAFSSLVMIINLIIKLVLSMLLGYAFGNYNFRFKSVLWFILLGTMILPEVALLSGQFKIIVQLGWDQGPALVMALAAPFVASVFTAYMFRNAFEAIPYSVKEAAMIDGVSGFSYFFKVAVPMVSSTTFVVAILTAFASWNSYMWPSLILAESSYDTIPLWLFLVGVPLEETGPIQPQLQMAGAVLAILPTIIIYFVFKKRIDSGVANTGGGTKG